MNLFIELPPEISTMIFAEANHEALKAASQESSAAHALCEAHIFYMTRFHTMRDLKGDLLQDSVAIVKFPKLSVGDIHAHETTFRRTQ